MNKIGEKIINSINVLKSRGITIEHKTTEEGNEYNLVDKKYHLELIINPQRWIGLEFDLLDQHNKLQLNYAINTDLYPISRPKYYDTAIVIENEIVEFLEVLIDGRIKVGEIKGKPAMIIPKGDKFMLIKKGWFFTSSSLYKNLKEVESKGNFISL